MALKDLLKRKSQLEKVIDERTAPERELANLQAEIEQEMTVEQQQAQAERLAKIAGLQERAKSELAEIVKSVVSLDAQLRQLLTTENELRAFRATSHIPVYPDLIRAIAASLEYWRSYDVSRAALGLERLPTREEVRKVELQGHIATGRAAIQAMKDNLKYSPGGVESEMTKQRIADWEHEIRRAEAELAGKPLPRDPRLVVDPFLARG